MEWYELAHSEILDTPSLLVYPARVKQNIQYLLEMAGSAYSVRPHVKTNKMREVGQLLLDAGITKFKCATIAEAEMMALVHAADILLAHQPTLPKAKRLLQLIEHYPRTKFSALVDNLFSATMLSAVFSSVGKIVELYIDLNVGMNRSGIVPEKSFDLYKACKALPNIKIIGLHLYDGHLRDTDLEQRKTRSNAAFEPVEALAKSIFEYDKTIMKMVAGGSPSFPTHTHRKGVEFSPGTFVFWDWGYKHIVPDEPFEYAALVATRIVSIIDEKTICTDLGHKSVAAENPLPRVHFLNAHEVTPISQSEEHLVVKVPDTSIYQVGDLWYGVPVHICPTVALYAEAQIIEEHQIIAQWQVIARNRKINF
jgi:D-threonine aldolase